MPSVADYLYELTSVLLVVEFEPYIAEQRHGTLLNAVNAKSKMQSTILLLFMLKCLDCAFGCSIIFVIVQPLVCVC